MPPLFAFLGQDFQIRVVENGFVDVIAVSRGLVVDAPIEFRLSDVSTRGTDLRI